MPRVIDIHCHIATPETRPMAQPHRRSEYEPYDHFMGQDSKDHNVTTLSSTKIGPSADSSQ